MSLIVGGMVRFQVWAPLYSQLFFDGNAAPAGLKGQDASLWAADEDHSPEGEHGMCGCRRLEDM